MRPGAVPEPQTPVLREQSCQHHAVLGSSQTTAAAITHSAVHFKGAGPQRPSFLFHSCPSVSCSSESSRAGAPALDEVFKEDTAGHWCLQQLWHMRRRGGTEDTVLVSLHVGYEHREERALYVGQPQQLPKKFQLMGMDAHHLAAPGDPGAGGGAAPPGIQLTLPRLVVAILGLSRSTAWMQILYPCKDSPKTQHMKALLKHSTSSASLPL